MESLGKLRNNDGHPGDAGPKAAPGVGFLALQELPGAKIWRRMYESERQLATDALKFMKHEVAKRWK